MTNDITPDWVQTGLRNRFNIPVAPRKSPPLDELIKTILSQNTNDRNRDRAFHALKTEYAKWKDLVGSSPGELTRIIAPAGLGPTKSKRILDLINLIYLNGQDDLVDLCRMNHSEAYQRLMSIKGVGPKTASCVLLFSCGFPAFPVDTHIYRVTGRLGLLPKGAGRIRAHEILGRFFKPEHYLELHLNLVRLGREICKARKPDCRTCPLEKACPSAAADDGGYSG
jgi:endonuclease-3